MTKDMPEAALATVKAMTPVGRLGRAEEVAAAVAISLPVPWPASSAVK